MTRQQFRYLGSQQCYLSCLIASSSNSHPNQKRATTEFKGWAQCSAQTCRAGEARQGGYCQLHRPCRTPLTASLQSALRGFPTPLLFGRGNKALGKSGNVKSHPQVEWKTKILSQLWKLCPKGQRAIIRVSPSHHQGQEFPQA